MSQRAGWYREGRPGVRRRVANAIGTLCRPQTTAAATGAGESFVSRRTPVERAGQEHQRFVPRGRAPHSRQRPPRRFCIFIRSVIGRKGRRDRRASRAAGARLDNGPRELTGRPAAFFFRKRRHGARDLSPGEKECNPPLLAKMHRPRPQAAPMPRRGNLGARCQQMKTVLVASLLRRAPIGVALCAKRKHVVTDLHRTVRSAGRKAGRAEAQMSQRLGFRPH